MTDLSSWLLVFTTGVLLGLVFFWGLWATVNQLDQVHYPAVLVLGSLMLRFGLVLVVFYLLTRNGGWEHVLVAAIGFSLTRLLIVSRTRPDQNKKELDI